MEIKVGEELNWPVITIRDDVDLSRSGCFRFCVLGGGRQSPLCCGQDGLDDTIDSSRVVSLLEGRQIRKKCLSFMVLASCDASIFRILALATLNAVFRFSGRFRHCTVKNE